VCKCCRWLTTTRSVYRLHDSSKATPSCLARPIVWRVKSTLPINFIW